MYKQLRPLLFKISKDPETVHNLALSFLRAAGFKPLKSAISAFYNVGNAALEQTLFKREFKNPVGLAGGFDKNGEALKGLESLGFGFLEVGTVTKFSQPGNPRQRIFRLNDDRGLINRMGFNNKGADYLAKKLSKQNSLKIPLGISLGKSKITELKNAAEDYLYSFSKLYNYGDYFVVNISSPNTPGLRELQDKKYLTDIISALSGYRLKQNIYKPILLKIVVDFSLEAVDEILKICQDFKLDGIITSNTSIGREGLKVLTHEAGGLSGAPIKERSTALIKHIHKQAPSLPIIGVGGIFTAEDAYEKIKAGASLVQVYTGFIYEGPFIVKQINQGLIKLLQQGRFKNISEAVGVDTR